MRTLRGLLEGAAEGTSAAVLLCGEAGVGKATLMERLLAEAPEGALVLRGWAPTGVTGRALPCVAGRPTGPPAGIPDRRPAAVALRGAVERATPLEARPVLDKVDVLARSARIDVSVVPEPEDEGGSPWLTRREREILEHVVAGRTYGEIAEALYVSEKTVSSHISNMLRKTGTSNRHELAARALASRR